MVKRKYNPAKGKWWLPGGRVFFGESLVSAVKRKLREEIGVKGAASIEFLGVGETGFKKGYFGRPFYSVNNVFLVKIGNSQVKKINLDLEDHFRYKWLKKVPRGSHSYLKKFLKLASFKSHD